MRLVDERLADVENDGEDSCGKLDRHEAILSPERPPSATHLASDGVR